MTIKSDSWISKKCQEKVFELTVTHSKVATLDKPMRPVVLTLDELKSYPVAWMHANTLEVGETITIEHEHVSIKRIDYCPMIAPFERESVNKLVIDGVERKIPSYGLSSYGYDIRLGRNFKIFKVMPGVVDMLNPPADLCAEENDVTSIVVPPLGMVLGVSVEKISMPRNVTATCMAKSTLARLGLSAQVTPLEAGWSGFITLEIFNMTQNAVRLYSGIGIMQLTFHESEQCDVSYADRGGKYMDQPASPVEARL